MLCLAHIYFNIIRLGIGTNDHTRIHRRTGPDEERSSLLGVEEAVGHGRSGLVGNKRSLLAVGDVSLVGGITGKDGIHNAVALGIGQEANDDMLAEFTGTKDTVVHAYSGGQLAQMIKVVAVTASQIGSKSMTLSNETGEEVENEDVYAAKQKLLGQQIQDFVGDKNNGDVPFDIGW